MAKLGTTSFKPGIPTRADYIDARVLLANTAKQHSVPPGKSYCYISAEMPVYIAWGSSPTASIPISDTIDGSGSYLMVRDMWLPCSDIAKISVIARASGVVAFTFYA